MAPASLKRLSPSDSSDDGSSDAPGSKKRRTDSYLPQTPPSGSTTREEVATVDGEVETDDAIPVLPSQNEEMDISLKRSIAIALKHVGFESASKESLEEFTQLVNSYTSKLLASILVSTTTCRRPIPIPQDYEYAFKRMQIDPSSLVPHTKLPHGLPSVRPQHLPQDPIPPPHIDHIALVNPKLTGEAIKASKTYIPKKFPAFPAVYTFRYTGYYPFEREQDPSKIREKGAEDRRAVEAILHRQLKHEGQHRNASSYQSERNRKTDMLRRKAMEAMSSGGNDADASKVVVVNANKRRYGLMRNGRK